MFTTEWFDGTSWSERANNYDNWRIGVTCLALDAEADLFYLVGGYCPTHADYQKYLDETFTYSPSENKWNYWRGMYNTLGRERHACGVIKDYQMTIGCCFTLEERY